MNRRLHIATLVAAMVAAGTVNALPPSALGRGARHFGNNKPAFDRAKRIRRKKLAAQSRRRNRQS